MTDPLTQQLVHFCELLKELRDAQTRRIHEKTASSITASTYADSTSWSDNNMFRLLYDHHLALKKTKYDENFTSCITKHFYNNFPTGEDDVSR